jgi:hypothetical protein
MSEGSGNWKVLDFGGEDGRVSLEIQGIKVKINPKHGVDVYTDLPVQVHPAANDDADAKATHEIRLRQGSGGQVGDMERDGDHKGEIYGGIYPADNKPIWFSAAPKLMDHYAAAAWAKEQGGSLPTRAQGDNAV